MKFLVVEDNVTLNQNIRDVLQKLGESDASFDGEEGLYMAEHGSYDLIILDLMLPKLNGFELLSRLRKSSVAPVIILTALDSTDKKIEGLKLGADDYMAKPFENDELLARVEAVLRRYNNNFNTKYVHKNIELDYIGKMLKINGEYIKLAGKMYDIVEYLIRNRNMIISKEQLFNRIWGYNSDTIVTVTEVYVSNIRKTLEKYDAKKYLKTIKNIGYMWSDKEDNEN
ncbi:MAG: response regulator transcription factor [Clostridia bacterium]|nr:response regulator transcription factor [Clostridia bacterium]